jgi:hypothetical protein
MGGTTTAKSLSDLVYITISVFHYHIIILVLEYVNSKILLLYSALDFKMLTYKD